MAEENEVIEQDAGQPGSSFDVMDRDQRVEEAARQLEGNAGAGDDKGQGAAAGEDPDKGQQAVAGADAAAEPTPEEKAAADKEARLTELREDPQFQELETFRDEVNSALEKYGIPDTKELGLQLDDAHVLYQIMQGKEEVGKLLDVAISNPGWSEEQKKGLAQSLIGWLQKNKFLEGEGQAAGAGKDGKFRDPLEDRLTKLEREREEQRQAQETEKVAAERKRTFNRFCSSIEAEMKASKVPVDREEFQRYVRQVGDLLRSNDKTYPAIYKRIAEGNFVDVKRAFAQVHKAELERLKKYNDNLARQQGQRDKTTPRLPAGGAPPAPAGSARKPGALTRDERLAAAAAEWEK